MPTFEAVQVNTEIDIDFEVYCGTCGEGLCGESDTRKSNNRGYLQVTVNACPNCMAEKEREIDELKEEIKSLENELNRES